MNKRDLIFAGAGFVVGYIVVKALNAKTTIKKDIKLPDMSSQTLPPATTTETAEVGTTQIEQPEVVETLDTPKNGFCKEKWIKFVETRKFSSADQEQATYDNFMASCVMQS